MASHKNCDDGTMIDEAAAIRAVYPRHTMKRLARLLGMPLDGRARGRARCRAPPPGRVGRRTMKPWGDDAMARRLGCLLDRTPVASAPPETGVAILAVR